MSDATQLTLGIDRPHRNHYLFSDHYLEEILRREASWTAAQPPAADFLNWLRDLYAAERPYLPAYNEAQLEDRWIKPILTRLGHVWEAQAAVPGLDKGIKKPDYVFFPDDDARRAAVTDQRTEEYARRALAVGEVKAWEVNLSRKSGGAAIFDNNNPMFQIDYYLKATGAAWGIVSNGRLWRLVHKDSSYRLDRYFEIDLDAALTAADSRQALAVATYFTLFFGRAAFAPGDAGRLFLDDVLAGSRAFAVALESDLRDNAYKALEQLILGFFAPAANGLDPADENHRAAVYRNSLLLLYRLLFLFFGESRGLLPMHNKSYRDRSLTALARAAARLVDDHQVDSLPPMTDAYWAQFKQLFAIIDGRDPALNAFLGVPRYNGGLFDPQRHAFLETKIVGERHLVRAIDYLARRRKTENGRYTGFETVDYRTLGVRQLGSIYEGLLEYRVGVAAEDLVTVRQGGKETWRPARERGKATAIETKQPGELYLATDKGERKATGSYYTPDYIVKYIVEQTLGPLVEEARQGVTSDELRAASGKSVGGRRSAVSGHPSPQSRFEDAILRLNVLDPAMGSGHFLVEATNFLARALATAEVGEARGGEEAGEQGSAAVPAAPFPPFSPAPLPEESDLTYWKRRVVEACIYGVDKNELAVELAKLSLWLETVAADKPLSFLDHHLRHGDSLIGARLADLERAPGVKRRGAGEQGGRGAGKMLFDESAFTVDAFRAVGGAARIEAILTDDLDAVHDKERILREMRDSHLARWRRLADLWVSAWFGNAMSAEEYRDLAGRLQGRPGGLLSDEQAARYLNHPAAAANDYFHWELEFPEVFFDEYGRPKGERAGFEAVVGNPPYVRIQTLQGTFANSVPYFNQMFVSSSGKYDLYVLFVERALTLLSEGSWFGMIVPNKFFQAQYGEALRGILTKKNWLRKIVDFGDTQVFDDITTYTAIVIARIASQTELVYIHSDTVDFGQRKESILKSTSFNDSPWNFSHAYVFQLLTKLNSISFPLATLCEEVFQGIITGGDDHFILYCDTASLRSRDITVVTRRDTGEQYELETELLKPFVKGVEVRDFHLEHGGTVLLYPYHQEGRETTLITEIELEQKYPLTFEYLNRYREQLSSRGSTSMVYPSWYSHWCPRLNWKFEGPKIITPVIAAHGRFHFDNTGLYFNGSGGGGGGAYGIILKKSALLNSHFLIAILNSTLIDYIVSQTSSIFRGAYFAYNRQYIDPLPIRQIDFSTSSTEREILLERMSHAFNLKQYSSILDLASSELTNERTDTIHDLLAYLAEQMIAMHQEKQAITADFWTDLEGAAAPATYRKLRDKGKQAAGLAADPALAPHLAAAGKSSRTLDDSLAWDEAAFKAFVRALAGPVDSLSRLVAVYHSHAPRYRELVERIGRTDWLIDQIVYQLYGLTDAEIAIVEGRAA